MSAALIDGWMAEGMQFYTAGEPQRALEAWYQILDVDATHVLANQYVTYVRQVYGIPPRAAPAVNSAPVSSVSISPPLEVTAKSTAGYDSADPATAWGDLVEDGIDVEPETPQSPPRREQAPAPSAEPVLPRTKTAPVRVDNPWLPKPKKAAAQRTPSQESSDGFVIEVDAAETSSTPKGSRPGEPPISSEAPSTAPQRVGAKAAGSTGATPMYTSELVMSPDARVGDGILADGLERFDEAEASIPVGSEFDPWAGNTIPPRMPPSPWQDGAAVEIPLEDAQIVQGQIVDDTTQELPLGQLSEHAPSEEAPKPLNLPPDEPVIDQIDLSDVLASLPSPSSPRRTSSSMSARTTDVPPPPGADNLAGKVVDPWDEIAGADGSLDLDKLSLADVPPAAAVPAPAAAAPPSNEPPWPQTQQAADEDECAALMRGARELFDLGDFSGSLDLVEKVLGITPDHKDALAYMKKNESTLLKMYESKLGDMRRAPRPMMPPDEVIWMNMHHKAGFILSQVDGQLSYEDILEISGMSRFDTMRILHDLVQQRIIG